MDIRLDDLSAPAVRALLAEHLEHMYAISPPGSVHALDVDGLQADDITFWSAWEGSELAGCAALRALDARTGEIKSMHTARAWRRKGVASVLVEYLVAEARDRGYAWLYLETGATEHFDAARTLYARHGFEPCGAFSGYTEDPHSFFMRLRVASSESPAQP